MTIAHPPVWPELFGRFAWHDLPFVRAWQTPDANEIIGAGAGALVVVGALAAVVLLTRYRLWGRLWSEWLTSLDHKKIGIMYVALAFVMLSRALVEAVLMRTQQAAAIGNPGFVSADHFAQLFSTHGSIMVFFMAMPFLTGIINYVVPLQIGARDMAFPWANAIALSLTAGGAALLMVSRWWGNSRPAGGAAIPLIPGSRSAPMSAPITGSGR